MPRHVPVRRTALVSLAVLAACQPHGPARPQQEAEGPPEAAALDAFDPAGVGPGAPPTPETRPLEVVDYGPIGRSEGGEIHVRFNQPVVALDLPPEEGLGELFRFDPPLAGRAYWKTPELLVFEPSEELRDCHGYTARFVGSITGLGGLSYDRPLQWQFETVRPTVIGSFPDAGAEEHLRDAPVFVQFDRPIALAEMQAHVQATARALADEGAPTRPVPVQVRAATKKEIEDNFYDTDSEATKRYFAVRARGPWPGDSEIEVSVTPGLRSLAGPLPLDTPWSMRVTTIRAQAIEEQSCSEAAPCGLEPITLKLRNPVTEKQIKRITVTPRPRDLSVSVWDDWGEGGREVTIEGMFEPETTYTIRVPKDLRDVYGQTIGGSGEIKARVAAKATVALSTAGGILMADGKQTIGVESRHVKALKVRVAALEDAEVRALDGAELAGAMPARATAQIVPLTPSGKGDWSSIALDLAAMTGGARRPVLVEVEAAELVPRATAYGAPAPVRALVRLTELGPVATVSLPATGVQVMRLSTAQPVPGVRVYRHDARGAVLPLGVTDVGGAVTLPHGLASLRDDGAARPPVRLFFADPATDDRTYLDLADVWAWPRIGKGEAPGPLRPGERLIAKVVSERGVYRPGEVVRVVGWSALDTPFSRSNLAHLPPDTPVTFELRDGQDRVVAVHATRTTEDGKFWAELPVPAEARLGHYEVRAALAGGEATASVKVEDYRVPEFAVEARAGRTDVLAGEATTIEVDARYYFGGAVPIQRLTSRTDCAPRAYRPPGLEDIWTVGEPMNWRRSRASGPRVVEALPEGAAPGHASLPSRGPSERVRLPHRCDVAVEVQDVSLQGIGAETQFMIHPASFYAALAVPRGWHEAGERGLSLPVRAVDIAGARVAATGVEVRVVRQHEEPSYRKGSKGETIYTGMVEKAVDVTTCRLDLPAVGDDPACALPPLAEGRYEIEVVGREPGEAPRETHTQGRFHVWPKRIRATSWRSEPIQGLEIKTDLDQVRPGDTLAVAVRGPWPGAHGNLVLAHGGVREVRPFVLADGTAEMSLAVGDDWTPEMTLQATVVVPPGSSRSRHPSVHHEERRFPIAFDHRRLAVEVEAPSKAGPGDSIDVAVRVRDDQGMPTAARVALWAVDEAVLALTDYMVPDLLPSFVPRRGAETVLRDDYRSLLWPFTPTAEDPWFDTSGGIGLGGIGSGGGGGGSGYGRGAGAGYGGAAGPPPARSRFETTPLFLADVAVDVSGRARVQATMPENLTTFRITAIASAPLVDGASPGRFGTNDARTMVTAPLVLRSALPRHLRPGDDAEIAAIVQNYTGAPGRVEVVARVAEGTGQDVLEVLAPSAAGVDLEVSGQARLPFRVAARRPGAPEIELQATFTPAGGGAPVFDGMRVPVPIEPERTLTERVATYGSLTDDAPVAIPIKIPADVLPGHGGIQVSATSSLMGELEDAVAELVNYPYGCLEQTSSKLLPMIALGELHTAYPLGVGDPAVFVRAGIERILSMRSGAGFSYWPGEKEVHEYASAYATWVLYLAKRAGYAVPEEALTAALDGLERRFGGLSLADVPVDWGNGAGARAAIAVHVLAEAGRDVSKATATLYPARQSLPLFGRAFLLMAMHARDPRGVEVHTLAAELRGALQELQATAHAVEQSSWGLDEYFSSDGRSDAIVLMALLRVEPDHPVIVKLARGLLERRVGGKWRNTQENAYALVALAEYARIYEAEAPDFTAQAWVGGAPALREAMRGRTAGQTATVDMTAILDLTKKTGSETIPVVLRREGQGRMYYRLGAEWAPASAELPARAQGLTLARTLRGEGGAVAATVDAGAPLAIGVTVTNDTRVRYVVVDVPLPAGFEAVSRTLGRGRKAATLGGGRGWWVTHEEQRRDRVVLFADDLPPGTHVHTIDVRATSRGRFSFPPAHAEAMYMPEVYGRTAGATLEVR